MTNLTLITDGEIGSFLGDMGPGIDVPVGSQSGPSVMFSNWSPITFNVTTASGDTVTIAGTINIASNQTVGISGVATVEFNGPQTIEIGLISLPQISHRIVHKNQLNTISSPLFNFTPPSHASHIIITSPFIFPLVCRITQGITKFSQFVQLSLVTPLSIQKASPHPSLPGHFSGHQLSTV